MEEKNLKVIDNNLDIVGVTCLKSWDGSHLRMRMVLSIYLNPIPKDAIPIQLGDDAREKIDDMLTDALRKHIKDSNKYTMTEVGVETRTI